MAKLTKLELWGLALSFWSQKCRNDCWRWSSFVCDNPKSHSIPSLWILTCSPAGLHLFYMTVFNLLRRLGQTRVLYAPPVEFIKLYYCFLTLFSFFTHWCVLVELITNCLPDYKCFMLLRALLKRCLQSQRDDLINRLLRRKGPKVETEQITVVFFPFCYSVTHLNVVFYRTAGWIGYRDIVETL